SGEPLSEGDVTARIQSPSGNAQVVRLTSGGEESWGAFEARYTADEPGLHPVTLMCKQTGESVETSFFVQGAARERIGQAARPKVLEELARLTGGKTLAIQEPNQWIDVLKRMPEPPSTIRRVPLWSHPATVGILLGALTLFWIGRKAGGMVYISTRCRVPSVNGKGYYDWASLSAHAYSQRFYPITARPRGIRVSNTPNPPGNPPFTCYTT
ncbi:MAG TPA: hypothetical protein DCE81_01240, partial [Cytophagales bacterium]|nr:hypothetical protein [Cytophagales bacterium]